MPYKTILVHADRAPWAAARMHLAVRLALRCGAHLTAAAFSGVSRHAPSEAGSRQLPQVEQRLAEWRKQARTSLAAFAAIAGRAGLARHSQVLMHDDAEGGLLLQSPCHDLLVLSQHGPDADAPGAIRDLPAGLLLNGGRPLLLVPRADSYEPPAMPFQRPLLAWDGGNTAARAISNAVPLLKLAQQATLLVLNGERSTQHGMEAGADMALFLARHGVRVEVLREFTRAPAGEALLAVAAERGSDLLVMGGYGHQRLRQALLGGTTRQVLQDMTLPVLIAH